MDDNKSKALAAALSQIEKQFGKGSIMKMDAEAAKDIEVVSTGSLGLGGGAVVDGDVVAAFLQQVACHRIAHDAEPEERNFRHLFVS